MYYSYVCIYQHTYIPVTHGYNAINEYSYSYIYETEKLLQLLLIGMTYLYRQI